MGGGLSFSDNGPVGSDVAAKRIEITLAAMVAKIRPYGFVLPTHLRQYLLLCFSIRAGLISGRLWSHNDKHERETLAGCKKVTALLC